MGLFSLAVVVWLGCSTESADSVGGPDADQNTAGDEAFEPETTGPSRVVVVVMDGVRVDESLGEGTSSVTGEPTADYLPRVRAELLPEGTHFSGAINSGATFTAEGHNTLVTGHRSTITTAPDSEYGSYRSALPTLFELLRQSRGLDKKQVVAVVNTQLLDELVYSSYPGLGESFGGTMWELEGFGGDEALDTEVILTARDYLEEHDTHFMLLNLHHVDLGGHNGEDLEYADRAKLLDDPIADLWAWLQTHEPYAGDTTMVLVADHGRHRRDDEEDQWKEHGDQCVGCRQIPLLFVGPGVPKGRVVDGTVTLSDVSRTLAAVLEIEHVYGDGVVLADAFVDPPDQLAPSGDVRVAVAGDFVSTQRWGAEGTRSMIYMEGEQLSDKSLHLHAEAPVVAAGDDQAFVCWRQLSLSAGELYWDWMASCAYRNNVGLWLNLPLGFYEVSPIWAPGIAVGPAGGYWLLDDGDPYSFSGKLTRPRLVRNVDGTAWEEDESAGPELVYPTHLDLLLSEEAGGAATVAVVSSEDEATLADSRHIRVYGVDWPVESKQAWVRHEVPDTPNLTRATQPALFRHEGALVMAFVGYREDGTVQLFLQHQVPGSLDWESAARIEGVTNLFPHLSPTWTADGVLLWASQADDGLVSICGLALADGSVGCIETGRRFVDGLSHGSDGIYANLSDDLTGWETVVLGPTTGLFE